MQGQTESLPEENREIEGALEYKFFENTFVPLKHPVGEDLRSELWCSAAHKEHGSLVPSFCRSYISNTERKVIAIALFLQLNVEPVMSR